MSQDRDQHGTDRLSGMDSENETDRNKFIPGAMGDRIAYLRKQKKMTQAQLAVQLGISAQAVSKWESGLSCPDIMTLVPLAHELGVSTDELLGVSGGREAGLSQEKEEKSEEGRSDSAPSSDQASDCGWAEEEETDQDQASFSFQSLLVIPGRDGSTHAIRELCLGAGACAAVIRNGSDFGLELSGYLEDEIISEVTDEVWTIRDVADKRLFRIGRSTISKRKMIITIPAGYRFDTVRLNIGAGTLNGTGICADKSVLSVGAGQVTMENFISRASKITCGMGEITVRGELYGKCAVDCGMGSIKLFIREPERYGYRASVGMGEVRIGENKLSGIGGNQTMNAGAPNFYKVSCSMGEVNISFTDRDA